MSQTTPSTQARLAFWVSPEHADDFNAQITRTLGFTRAAPNPRREIEGVCSRLLTLTHPDGLDTIQHQLTTDADWVAQLKELSTLYAPSPNEEIS